MNRFLAVPVFLLAVTAPVLAQRPPLPAGLTVYLTGDPADSPRQNANGPMAILMGGSTEPDAAFTQHAFPVLNGGDIVVLRTTGSDGYNDYFYSELVTGELQPHSVETILLTTPAHANSDYVKWALDTAEMIWFAGGDQSAYLNAWAGTETQAAIQRAWNRGAVIGGTSAGLAILGEYIFDPDDVDAVNSERAIANPYDSGLIISPRFIDIPWLDNVITDTHFAQRDRLGRSLAFLARIRQDQLSDRIYGVAVDERTAICIDKDGLGTVVGNNQVYILGESNETVREQVQPGQPLIYRNIPRIRLEPGDTFDFSSFYTANRPLLLTIDGRNPSPFTPADPYAPATGNDMGDVDGLGGVTPQDAQNTMECFLTILCGPGWDLRAADVCPRPWGDGNLTPGDAQGIFEIYLQDPGPC